MKKLKGAFSLNNLLVGAVRLPDILWVMHMPWEPLACKTAHSRLLPSSKTKSLGYKLVALRAETSN